MRTEDDIRAALRELADDALDPSTILAALPSATRTDSTFRRTGRHGRLSRLVAPVAAATAVTAIIAGAVALSATGPDRPSAGSTPRTNDGLAPAAAFGIPRYYAETYVATTKRHVVTTYGALIGDLDTGRTIKVDLPARTSVVGIAAGADDRTFILSTVGQLGSGVSSLYLARLNAQRGIVSVRKLPFTVVGLQGMAVSPSNTAVAVAVGPLFPSHYPTPKIEIYALDGTLLRQWQSTGQFANDAPICGITWAQNGLLAFGCYPPGTKIPAGAIWVLNASTRSGNLQRSARLVEPGLRRGWSILFGGVLAGNGETVAATAWNESGGVHRFEVFSTETGRVVSQSLPISEADESVLWDNYSGSQQIVILVFDRADGTELGVLTRGRFIRFRKQKQFALGSVAF
jgi:hypothetical protein